MLTRLEHLDARWRERPRVAVADLGAHREHRNLDRELHNVRQWEVRKVDRALLDVWLALVGCSRALRRGAANDD